MIKRVDPEFSREEFIAWAKDLFIKLQYAWSDRNWETIRCFETPQLFEHHQSQIQRYIDNKQINKIERVSVNWAKLFEFKQEGERDVLSILLNSKMIDYIISEETGKILKGNSNDNKVTTYKLTFIRKTGVKTVLGETTVNTTNCPNCGAPTEITSSGKCSYCGSVITTGNFNWVLSNLEPYRGTTSNNNINNNNINRNSNGFSRGVRNGFITGSVIRGMTRPRPPRRPPPPRNGGRPGGPPPRGPRR